MLWYNDNVFFKLISRIIYTCNYQNIHVLSEQPDPSLYQVSFRFCSFEAAVAEWLMLWTGTN